MSDEYDLQAAFGTAAKLLGRDNFRYEAKFHPYAGLKGNIRFKGGAIVARISDGYKAASLNALTGLAIDLMRKLFRIRHIGGSAAVFLEEFNSLNGKGMHGLHESLREKRGRKRKEFSSGIAYDLNLLLDKVVMENSAMFENVQKPTIVWSKQISRRRLAFYDAAFDQIVVSRKFDSERCPQYFLEYLIFHELLHAKHDPKYGKRRRVHHREFHIDEKKFPRYEDAQQLIKRW
ncbi:MAG: hypothetical protein ABIG96_02570 [Candidatus Micrarchaeota archaeon]